MSNITYDPNGDTPARIEDKVRALPENQGINDNEMWLKIDEAVKQADSAGKLIHNEGYQDKHGNK